MITDKIGILLIVLLVFWPRLDFAGQNPRWAEVKVDTLRIELFETGEVGAVKSTTIAAPQIWGMDLQITDLVPEGTLVDSGEVLVQFDRSSLLAKAEERQTELDMRKAELKSMQTAHQAQINSLKREVEIAKYALQLAKVQLEQLQFESDARKEDGKLEVLKAEIALKESQTRLKAQRIINAAKEKKQQLLILQAEGDVKEIQHDLARLTLHAPISGLVVYHADWNGSKPQVGGKVRPGRGVIDLPDLSRMQVKIRVNEIDAAKMKIGQNAIITLEAFPQKRYTGQITSIAQIPDALERNSQIKVFETILEIAEKDTLLKPGMTAQARLQLGMIPDATLIPVGCVFEQAGQPVVFKKKAPKKPYPVKLGLRNDFYVQVDGLQPGEKVAWQAGDNKIRPLGYQAYQESVRIPDSLKQRYFAEMKARHLTFDYEAFRNRPPEPPGGAPGGLPAMLQKFGSPSGEMMSKSRSIKITPEMLKQFRKGPKGQFGKITLKGDSGTKTIKIDPGQLPPGIQMKTFRVSKQGKAIFKKDSTASGNKKN